MIFGKTACGLMLITVMLLPCRGDIVHRWSFNHAAGLAPPGTIVVDSVSGAYAVVVGVGATFNGLALSLPGGPTGNLPPSTIPAYVDLPNHLLSARTNLTLEIWATLDVERLQHVFTAGRMDIAGMGTNAAPGEIRPDAMVAPGPTLSSDVLGLWVSALSPVTNFPTHILFGGLNGSNMHSVIGGGQILSTGVPLHIVVVANDGLGKFGTNGMQTEWYVNGARQWWLDLGFRLSAIEDVNFWLGRSQVSAEPLSKITYDEVRIYDYAMTREEVTDSFRRGTAPEPPRAVADSTTLHHHQKTRVSVLENDQGLMGPSVPMIVIPPQFGRATVEPSGTILYAHTNGTPANDLLTYCIRGVAGTSAPATVSIQFTPELRLANHTAQLPSTPQAAQYEFVPAFGGLGFNSPLCMRTPTGETNRLFVCEQGGLVRVIPDLRVATAFVFLNLPAVLSARNESIRAGGEQGLLGMAFHPGYATNGFFFVYYSVATNNLVYQRLSRFRVSMENANAANPASEIILFSQADPAGNHNGGDLHFGPDGYLYISLGDGGGGWDFYNNSQRIDKGFFSAIARIDVDKRPGNLAPNPHAAVPLYGGQAAYFAPADNPFVGASSFNGRPVDPNQVRTEFFAVGLRNPWRFSFDLVTSNLWCGDVGALYYEEVQIVEAGKNYGWAYREGAHGTRKAPEAPADFDAIHHTPPLYDYVRGFGEFQGASIIGGFVYRGANLPALYGHYIFGDFVSGHVWSMRLTNGTPVVSRLTTRTNIAAFAPDPSNGDILAADLVGGRILRLALGTPADSPPGKLNETGLFADITDLSPAPGVLPYELNLSSWSDHSLKTRWFTIPNVASRMTWSRDGLWTLPPGQIWVEHFDLEMERGNPLTKRRIETRLLVRNDNGAYAVSYRWNEEQTDAVLVPGSGMDFDLSITNTGATHKQRWRIPSRAECMTCHTPAAGYALSFTTRRLNRTATLNGFHGNQLELLRDAAYFVAAPEPVNTLPRHVGPSEASASLETRVRSYLDVNCAHCHSGQSGEAFQTWDARASIPLSAMRIINGVANNDGGNPGNKLIVPQDALHSIVLSRVAATNGFTRMPPLASTELDWANIELLRQWIEGYDTNRLTFNDWQIRHFGSANNPQAASDADPDGDGRRNELEFLLGTFPTTTSTGPDLTLSAVSNVATLEFSLSPSGAAQALVSTNLIDWSPWDVEGNNGIPKPYNPQKIVGPITNGSAFFRLRLSER